MRLGKTWLREDKRERGAARERNGSGFGGSPPPASRLHVGEWRAHLHAEANAALLRAQRATSARRSPAPSAPLVDALRGVGAAAQRSRGGGDSGGADSAAEGQAVDDAATPARQLQSIFAPALAMPRGDARAARAARSAARAGVCAFVLLSGTRGSGKRATVRDAAEALSLTVVERRWRELVGHGNAQRAEESLRALFADAAAQVSLLFLPLHFVRILLTI